MRLRIALVSMGLALLSCARISVAANDSEKVHAAAVEAKFIETVQSYSEKENFKHTIEDRKDAVSRALGGTDVKGWTGVITALEKSENGDYTLALTVGDTIVLRIGAQADSELKSTRVPADSELCGPLGRMKLGQKVVFEGSFLRDKAKGPNKGGLAGNGNFAQPEYAFHLQKIKGQRPPPLKTWKEIVDGARNQVLTLHNAGGGNLSLLDFARAMDFKIKGDTETMLRDRGDLIFKATGDHSGEFTNEGPVLDIKCKVGHIEVPKVISGTYTCADDRTVLKFNKSHTFNGKVSVVAAPLDSITADDHNVTVKIGGVMGGVLSRTLPIE